MRQLIWLIVLLAILTTPEVFCQDHEDQSLTRVAQVDDLDESSCICGLNKDVLERIESIVKIAASSPRDSCPPSSSGGSLISTSSTSQQSNEQADHHSGTANDPHQQPSSTNAGSNGENNNNSGSDSSQVGKLTSEIQALQNQLAGLRPQQQQQDQAQQQETQRPGGIFSWFGSGNSSNLRPSSGELTNGNGNQPSGSQPSGGFGWQTQLPTGSSSFQMISNQQTQDGLSNVQQQQQQRPVVQQQTNNSGGFLVGLPSTGGSQQVIQRPAEVQEAVVATVPNVVSNIFTNIQDFAIKTEKNPNASSGTSSSSSSSSSNGSQNQLTSIDGSSAHLGANATADQITAQGEQLFLQWIEHQIQAYHMTASMAAYIRTTALNLFRRIVRQYVERIERVGGTVQYNVRQATQLALSNTQNLISFLLRNYLNVAGGLMRIIGEQVSRVGKQLDSTGGTIAQVNLNPFDIVSNVFDSLPNPSRYSEYFRAFGKYLMGEPSTASEEKASNQEPEQSNSNNRRGGLFSKTMGALSKTLGSWIG